MKVNSPLLKIVLPITVILLGFFIYDYGYRSLVAEEASLAESRAVKRKSLEKYVTMVAQKPLFEKRITELKEIRKGEANKIFDGQTPALASAALQNALKNMIAERGGTIISERVEKPEDFGKLKIIAVTVDAILPDARALMEALYALETQHPDIVMRELDTRVRNFREPKELTVRVTAAAIAGGR